ncbi:MAG: sugar phosphate isomerase/epimerase, partial [Spirochaetes bacterium]|nr:sugar phosphate isomerase/epimerase [Spirochaetota bacterium]
MKPISLQLYTLRESSQKSFKTVLEQVAEIGFKGVEPAGFYGMTPREFRTHVNDLGMIVSSSHGPWASPGNLQEVIDTAGELGTRLVSSGFGADAFSSMDAIKKTADMVNGMYETLSKSGLELFLHNHWWEFEEIEGDLAFRHLAKLCSGVLFEIDTYWAADFGKVDPVAIVREYADRAPLLHIKDGPLVKDELQLPLGRGKMDVPAVIAAADPKVLQWVVVELDNYGGQTLTEGKESYLYLVENRR